MLNDIYMSLVGLISTSYSYMAFFVLIVMDILHLVQCARHLAAKQPCHEEHVTNWLGWVLGWVQWVCLHLTRCSRGLLDMAASQFRLEQCARSVCRVWARFFKESVEISELLFIVGSNETVRSLRYAWNPFVLVDLLLWWSNRSVGFNYGCVGRMNGLAI